METPTSSRQAQDAEVDRFERLLAEVAVLREDNSQLKKDVKEMKRTHPKRKLFKQEVDSDCSVS